MAFWLASFVVATLLFLLSNSIRRWTGGRIRYPEVHLAAWLPVLAFVVYALYFQEDGTFAYPAIFVIGAVFPIVVYFCSFWDRIFSPQAWLGNEARIDAEEAELSRKRQLRERIEAYKQGKRPGIELHPVANDDSSGSSVYAPLPLLARASGGPGTGSIRKQVGAGPDPRGFAALKGWRLGAALSLQFLLVCSVMLSLMCELDNVLQLSAPVAPVYFACAGVVAVVSTVLIALLTRGWIFFLPSLAIGMSLAGALLGFRLLFGTGDSSFPVQVVAVYAAKFVIGGSVALLLWAVASLFSISWKRKS